MTTITETVSATVFKARCLEIMDRVRDTGTSITITKHGRAVVRLVPIAAPPERLYASLPVTIVGDIVGPIDESWDADS